MLVSEASTVETLLKNVLHDLRQPLGVLEVTAYLMNRRLHDGRPFDPEHIQCLERQVGRVSRIVSEAAEQLSRLRV